MSPVDLSSLPDKSDRDLLVLAVRQLDDVTCRLDRQEERAEETLAASEAARLACSKAHTATEVGLAFKVEAIENRLRLAATALALVIVAVTATGLVKPELLRWVLTLGTLGA